MPYTATATPPGIDPAEHTRLVFFVANQVARRYRRDADALVGVGYLGLVRAARTFDPARGKFSTYACNRIKFELMNHLKYEHTRTLHPLLVDEDGLQIDPQAPPEDEPGAALDVTSLLRRLTPVERKVVELRFGIPDGHERTCDEVGAVLGVTGERAGVLLRRAVQKMRGGAGDHPR
jgi:RNA polymerase sporulation-specific sigma factor